MVNFKAWATTPFFIDMINVIQGINRKVVTLKDRIEEETPFLILWLQSESQTDFIKAVQVTDVAGPSCVYNEIEFEVVSSGEDLPNGKVDLSIGGLFNYKIFESDSAGTDITGKRLLENGLLNYEIETFTESTLNAEESEKTLLK